MIVGTRPSSPCAVHAHTACTRRSPTVLHGMKHRRDKVLQLSSSPNSMTVHASSTTSPGPTYPLPLVLSSSSSKPGGARQTTGSSSSSPSPRQQPQLQPQQPPGGPAPEAPQDTAWVTLVLLAATGIVICYADRSNMSTAILPMATAHGWDKAFQGVVLSAFFWGYAATQVLGGSLADTYGGKPVLSTGVALWSLFTVVTPQAAAAGVGPLLAARVLLGVGEGVAFPAIHSIIARNVPVERRSTAVAVITAASYAGTALAFGVSPHLITSVGWPWVFYLFGGAALLWLPFWLPMRVRGGTRGDKDSSSSSREEEGQPLLSGGDSSSSTAPPKAGGQDAAGGDPAAAAVAVGLPALMRRREVWAICGTQYCQSYGMYGLLTWLPSFFSDYYHVEVSDLAGYTLLPYVVQGLVGAASGPLADGLIARGASVRAVRVGLQAVGMLGPAACLLAAVSPLVGDSAATASGLITLGLGLSALTLGGVSVSHLDVAPRHAGQVFGLGNTAATVSGLVSVPLTGYLLQRTGSWLLVFGLIGAHFLVGTALWAAWVGDSPLPEDGPPEQPPAAQLPA